MIVRCAACNTRFRLPPGAVPQNFHCAACSHPVLIAEPPSAPVLPVSGAIGGAAIGAAFAGPPGAIVGGVIGFFVGAFAQQQ